MKYEFTTKLGMEEFRSYINGGTIYADNTFDTKKYGYLYLPFQFRTIEIWGSIPFFKQQLKKGMS